MRSCSAARSASSRSATTQPSRSGAADSSRASFAPAAVSRSAPATASQNRCGSRSWPCTGTHAVLSARPAAAIHDRSKNVFPLPAGADIWVTRPAPPSRSNSTRRETTPPLTAGAARAPAVPDRAIGPMMLSSNMALTAQSINSLRVFANDALCERSRLPGKHPPRLPASRNAGNRAAPERQAPSQAPPGLPQGPSTHPASTARGTPAVTVVPYPEAGQHHGPAGVPARSRSPLSRGPCRRNHKSHAHVTPAHQASRKPQYGPTET
jgi:hypothetical protein